MNLAAIKKILSAEPGYRHKQVNEAIFGLLIDDWSEALTLPKALRERLAEEAPLQISAEVVAENRTEKALVELSDGNKIEAVLIKNIDGRNTICVSSQVGCALGCAFCATGKLGFKRNLSADEILSQVLFFARRLKKQSERVDNVVFMGMGEPFMNTENVLTAIEMLNDKDGLNIAARSISLSTCGIPSGIRELIKFPLQINLALSLHSPTDELRKELMPIARKYSLRHIFDALKDYMSEKNRKIMIEYIMIEDVNDSAAQGDKLADLLEELPKHLVMINLIPYNPTEAGKATKYKPSPANKINFFKNVLGRRGYEATIRESLGGSISGACGQLAGKRSH